MDLVASFVRNPVKVTVGVLLVALFGLIAAFRLPVQLVPEVQTPTITIETTWIGASPQEVESEIVREQEEQLRSVEGVTKLTSECMDSLGRVTMEFAVGADMSEALVKVTSRLQQVREYPEAADEPVIATTGASNQPIAWFILRPRVASRAELEEFIGKHPELRGLLESARRAQSSGLRLARLKGLATEHPEIATLLPPPNDVTELLRFAEDTIEARFERVDGVSNANVLGGREEELQVIVDPARLAARSLTLDDVRSALRGRNADTSGGDFWEGKRRWVVRTLGKFRDPGEVASVVLARRDGMPVYVRDVADVKLGFKKPAGFVRNFGSDAIAVNAVRDSGANVIEVMKGLRIALAELNERVLAPKGLQLEQVYDETEYIDSAIELVRDNIILGGFLTVIVLVLFLRSGRSTLIISLAIPTSIIGTFLILALLGRSLNVVSLAGLAFAVGMLVDNSVVVLENIYRYRQEGLDAFAAVIKGTSEVWGAVVASTLTTLAVFIPIIFTEEEAGQLFRDIAIAISAAVGLSMIVSAVVIPTAAAKALRGGFREGEHLAPRWLRRLFLPLTLVLDLAHAFGRGFSRLTVGTVAWMQHRWWRAALVALLLVGTSVWASGKMMPKAEYLPAGNRNLVFGIILPPPGYNLDELLVVGKQIEETLRPYWDIDPGDPNLAKLDAPAIQDFFYVARGRQVFLGVRALDPLRASELIPVLQRACFGIPGTFAVVKQSSLFEEGLSAGRTVDIEISGPDLTALVGLGRQVFGQVMGLLPKDAQIFPKPSLDLSNPEVHVTPRHDRAADVGLTAASLGFAVDALVDGAYAADYEAGGDRIDLTIMGQPHAAERTQDLEQLPLATPAGRLVTLGSVAEVTIGAGPEQINRRERQRTVTIQASPPPEMPLEDALDAITSKVVNPLIDRGLPPGVSIAFSGTADKLRAAWKALRFNVILALLITYLLMAALFESWSYPLVVILTVPLGAVGGFAGLALLNRFVIQPLDVLTMLGFVILIGTVVNNAILIVHQSLNHLREGYGPQEAIRESVRTRLRPIFMTTMTTVIGLVPLVVSPGAGSELYRGLGSVLLGGLFFSTVVTLVLIPAVLSILFRWSWARPRVVAAADAVKA